MKKIRIGEKKGELIEYLPKVSSNANNIPIFHEGEKSSASLLDGVP